VSIIHVDNYVYVLYCSYYNCVRLKEQTQNLSNTTSVLYHGPRLTVPHRHNISPRSCTLALNFTDLHSRRERGCKFTTSCLYVISNRSLTSQGSLCKHYTPIVVQIYIYTSSSICSQRSVSMQCNCIRSAQPLLGCTQAGGSYT
jgi:hypothetical protein